MANQQRNKEELLLSEWGYLPVDGTNLHNNEANGLFKAAEHAARELRLPEGAVLNRVVGGLKAGQVCGVITHRGRSLEILPKIDGTGTESRLSLVRMLSVAYDLRVSEGELAHLQTQRKTLLELLIGLFARRLTHAMKGGLQRQYVHHQEDLPFLRGSLDVGRQLSRRPVAPTLLMCRFDELSENTPINRLLRATALRLLHVCRSSNTRRELQVILDSFSRVAHTNSPLSERIHLDRSSAAFSVLIPMARLLLRGDWQNTTSGRSAGTALLFPMNILFEQYITKRAQQTLGRGIVRKQHSKHHALKNHLFQLRPDLVFKYGDRPVILDTKWKQLDRTDPKKLRVSQSDIYQMLAYGHSYTTAQQKPQLVLLYPHHADLNEPEGVLRQWSVTGSDLPLSIATVDISKDRSASDWVEFFSNVAPNHKPVVFGSSERSDGDQI
jgi:5-methylcytosine-specific restriction enzyme subunit McrC